MFKSKVEKLTEAICVIVFSADKNFVVNHEKFDDRIFRVVNYFLFNEKHLAMKGIFAHVIIETKFNNNLDLSLSDKKRIVKAIRGLK